ncbi:NADP-dependent phosphogluconate dehydrogenase [Nannocystis punicea]|uniref:6-phosphogluconate dehydrogenase, decarboxylating n=1 Tax=Nannocystis punicea TaxID=2995304 RepID=A0ABY7H395_9BACT|nr:NADP-dependent phosphogluconate dehydrogenase [Nannocystis poenicansa]WAS93751.1 NADP-dependent phosphogluconate dehydrogenase [Nannocystis poenicansa]
MSETGLCDLAVVGLGVMGGNLARNFASRGLRVAGYQRTVEHAHALAAAHPEAHLRVAATLEELVKMLERPRRLVLMVNAGPAVDSVLDQLDPLLEDGDIVVDGGNSLYTDTDRRVARAEGRPWRFVGMGVSGGSEGALLGPSIMPGGDRYAWERLRPPLEAIAARSASGVCVTYCGRGSAGHFVKMVHNGIEYGDMQLIAEVAALMREGMGWPWGQVADTFAEWNRSELESYLIEITADILRVADPQNPGSLLIDAILDRAGQKGTGKWTVMAAAEHGVPIPTIAAAVDARLLSAAKDLRTRAEAALRPTRGVIQGVSTSDLRDALYASKIASYTQGFALLQAASEARDYGTNLAEVARIWTGGCIIRAVFLERIRAAFAQASRPSGPEGSEKPELLVLAPDFAADVARRLPGWRRVVAAAAAAGHPIPGLSASLAWFDTLTQSRGSASLIQAQRDYFGSHTYERVDAPGVFVHTDWPKSAQ